MTSIVTVNPINILTTQSRIFIDTTRSSTSSFLVPYLNNNSNNSSYNKSIIPNTETYGPNNNTKKISNIKNNDTKINNIPIEEIINRPTLTTVMPKKNKTCKDSCDNYIWFIIGAIIILILLILLICLATNNNHKKNNKIEPNHITVCKISDSHSNSSDSDSTNSFEVYNGRLFSNGVYGEVEATKPRILTNDIYDTAETEIDSASALRPNFAHVRHLSTK